MNIEKLNLVELTSNDLEEINGGGWHVVGGALIWVLWEIFDSPDDFKKGFSDGLKGK